jgi:dihydrofolate synthase/folylpolyglutamate synthase
VGGKLTASASSTEYKRALEYLFARTTGAFKFGLERTEALLARLGNPERRYPSFHVAGTNGKGSTVATLAALLAATGRRVATYTSPHLVDFRERIVVGGRAIPEREVTDWIARHTPDVEALGASFFEATTALAFDHFARAGAEVAVIEVGLGGRLDSTNVLDPLVAGVTSIGVDHTEYLGDTIEQIAAEKAGIFKAGRPAVIGERDPRIASLLAAHAAAARARPVVIVRDSAPVSDVRLERGGMRATLTIQGQPRDYWTPLAGEHQAWNLATALTMLEAAGPDYALPADAVQHALGSVRVPGRFHRVDRWIFDVAHNPDGARVLVATLAAVSPPGPLVALIGVLADKDWRGMISTLAPAVDRLILTTPPTAPPGRVWDLRAASEFAAQLGIPSECIEDFGAALDRAATAGETVLVTGSFHTVGDAMLRLQVSPLAG